MDIIRRLFFGKKTYEIEKQVFKTINNKEYVNLIITIIGPLSTELQPYTYKETSTLKEEYLFLPAIDFINGYITSGLRINHYGELSDKDRFYKLKEAFLVSILDLDIYIKLKDKGFFDRSYEFNKEYIGGELAARERHYRTINSELSLSGLGAIMISEIQVGKKLKKLKKGVT